MDVYEVILVQKNKTWQKALDYCRKHYIDLVSLKADNWMKNAVEVTKAAQTAYVWTGLHFLSGEWFWAKGDALQYQAWSTEGQPKCPATNHRCVALGQKEEIWQPRAWPLVAQGRKQVQVLLIAENPAYDAAVLNTLLPATTTNL
ncbi:hypothetical protein AOLI_G00087530 [Acnodon oligacanthus]